MNVPLDAPKLGMIRFPGRKVWSNGYECHISIPSDTTGVIEAAQLNQLVDRLGTTFRNGEVGYALMSSFDGDHNAAGYIPAFDFNSNGAIDVEDEAFLSHHIGRRVRYNLYLDAYFGSDWLSSYYCVAAEHHPGTPIIADYDYGGGYDSQTGVIRLLDTPGPDRPMWVEYHYDAPAEPGQDNICIHLYREI
jgi:hypothetical protein